MYPYVCAHEQSKKKNQIKRIILKKLKEIIPGVAGKNIYLQGPDPANPRLHRCMCSRVEKKKIKEQMKIIILKKLKFLFYIKKIFFCRGRVPASPCIRH
jgi:hypothetical protein